MIVTLLEAQEKLLQKLQIIYDPIISNPVTQASTPNKKAGDENLLKSNFMFKANDS